MNHTGPRLSRRAVGYLAGTGLAGAALASPAAEQVARRWAIPGTENSRRYRWYYVDPDWMRDALSLADIRRDEPAGHRTLPLLLSSEATVRVEQNPSRLLFKHVTDFDLHYRGHALHQSFVHAVNLASMAQDLSSPRAAVIVSGQWFVPGGMTRRQYASVFSGSQFLRMRETDRISRATRTALLRRAGELGVDPLWLGPDSELQHVTLGPYRRTMRRAHSLQEVSRGTRAVAKLSLPWWQAGDGVPVAQLDFARLRAEAGRDAAAHLTNNAYNIDDAYFDDHLRGRLEQYRGSMRTTDYSRDSQEWDDLELLLRVAGDAGIELLVVGQPFNGPWYDFMGYDARRRARYATRLEQTVRRHGHRFVNLFDHEYEPGFMHDVTHIGWKGWIDVTEQLVRFATA